MLGNALIENIEKIKKVQQISVKSFTVPKKLKEVPLRS